mgnify:CR=1 FL=1
MSEPANVRIGQYLRRLGLTVAAAESCTGGLVSSLITDVVGSSVYFLGGVVTYANSAKAHMLDVDPAILLSRGAVSAEVAQAMARGVRRLFGADIGLAVTGIAGPAGGTAEKPVGLTYTHLSAVDAEWGERHVWQGDRLANKQQSAAAVLALLLRYVTQQSSGDAVRLAELALPDTPSIAAGDPVTVELRLAHGDPALPSAFVWRGQRYRVAASGRRWQESDSTTVWQCLLVQTAEGDTFELCHRADTGVWTVVRAWLQPHIV